MQIFDFLLLQQQQQKRLAFSLTLTHTHSRSDKEFKRQSKAIFGDVKCVANVK